MKRPFRTCDRLRGTKRGLRKRPPRFNVGRQTVALAVTERGMCHGVSGALVVEHLRQGVLDLDEVGLIRHHLIDVLVSRGNLIDEG